MLLRYLPQVAEKGHEAVKEYAAEAEVEGGVGDIEIHSNVRSVIGCLLSGTTEPYIFTECNYMRRIGL